MYSVFLTKGFPHESEVISMSVYEALSLMIAFATLIVLVISAR
ncbi:putative holin-like toxin [Megasphaera sp.]